MADIATENIIAIPAENTLPSPTDNIMENPNENVTASREESIIITNGSAEQSGDQKIEEEPIAISEKERELLDVVFNLESEKQALVEQSNNKIGQLARELHETKAENEKLKKKNTQLEQNLKQTITAGVDCPKSKKELDDVLIRAKTLLFEKTKECKNKDQQIETLKTQVDAIKEVLTVTKEMLNLRSVEVEHMQARLETMNNKVKTEREKCGLVEKKLCISQKLYEDLRKEYDFQSKCFKELKETYELKIDVLNKTIEKLK